ncbi:triose-phosphate isomerase [Marinomonas transparens]|uniref:Triosephosphate isomerase n=1 Tax=Marinomonas transparens TaxID=2795388 RepID=A0A934JXL0_9GAMM|nr:triose-phosphate isomerase [Marinomonas transparens]MBJ7539120.1 triose-phosphate isomerase [Marinomonas transparens]
MNNKKPFWIGTSWKMNKTLEEAMSFSKALLVDEPNADPRIQRFVIPPFPLIHQVKQTLYGSAVKVGAQNMHWAENGAWTGEISPLMLKDAQLDLVELGHSERREFFAESNETVGRKVAAAIHHGLIPLICIGETLADKESGNAAHFLAEQVKGALQYLITEEQKQAPILFAYEPIWAIGEHGIPASPEYANLRQGEIIALTFELLGQRLPCLYGGSVNQDNCEKLIAHKNIDGLFIGRSAWDVNGYISILNKCLTVINSIEQ